MKHNKEDFNRDFKGGIQYLSFDDELFNRLFPDSSKGEALDFGCGRGNEAVRLAEKGFNVDAVDFSEEAFNRKISHPKVSYHLADENFDNGKKYDIILLKLVLAFVEDKKAFLVSLQTKLKKGGKLIVVSPILSEGYDEHQKSISVDAECLKSFKCELSQKFKNGLCIEYRSIQL